jgi:hypothetical protein
MKVLIILATTIAIVICKEILPYKDDGISEFEQHLRVKRDYYDYYGATKGIPVQNEPWDFDDDDDLKIKELLLLTFDSCII